MDLLNRLLYTAIGAASIFFFIIKISLSHWKNRGILHEKPKFLWGHLKGVGSKQHISVALQNMYQKYKGKAPFIGFYAYFKPMILVLDLNLIKCIVQDDAGSFKERGLYHNVESDPLSGNLLQMDGYSCYRLRNKLQPIFEEDQMQRLLPALMKVAATFKYSLAQKQMTHEIMNINELIDCYNVDVVSSLAFGLDGNTLQYAHTEFRLMTRSYLKNFSFVKSFLAFMYPNIARAFHCLSFSPDATSYFLRIINEKLAEREYDGPHDNLRYDFLSCFAQLKRSRQGNLTNKQIAAQSFSFVVAGLQASNSTLTFCLYELALQPDLQCKARAEIEHVLQKHKDTITVECLHSMIYLKQILYETMRKHSPYPVLMRTTIKDYEVPNSVFMFKEDNQLLIPISSIHYNPEIYPEPEKFDPQRFTTQAIAERHPMAFLPFGSGSRCCIAKNFVELQMLVCLVVLLKDYHFTTCSVTCTSLQYDNTKFFLAPKSEIKLRIERIERMES